MGNFPFCCFLLVVMQGEIWDLQIPVAFPFKTIPTWVPTRLKHNENSARADSTSSRQGQASSATPASGLASPCNFQGEISWMKSRRYICLAIPLATQRELCHLLSVWCKQFCESQVLKLTPSWGPFLFDPLQRHPWVTYSSLGAKLGGLENFNYFHPVFCFL